MFKPFMISSIKFFDAPWYIDMYVIAKQSKHLLASVAIMCTVTSTVTFVTPKFIRQETKLEQALLFSLFSILSWILF